MTKTVKATTLLLLLLALLALPGCALAEGLLGGRATEEPLLNETEEPEEDPEYPVSLAGADLAMRPERVISLSPALTEKVLDLGLESQLAGVSRYCRQALPGAQNLPDCGTMLLPDLDTIRELEPYLVLTSAPLPENALVALQQMGVETAVLPRAGSLQELMDTYQTIAILLEGQTTGGETGAQLVQRFDARLAAITAATAPYPGDLVLYLRALPFVMATGDTLEHELLTAANLQNVAVDQQGWLYGEEAAQSAEAREQFMAVLTIFMDQSAVTITDLEQSDYYRALPAVLQDRYLYVDAAAFERQGMAMLDELERMALACYPDCGLTPPQAQEPQPEEAQAQEAQPQQTADGAAGGETSPGAA